MMKLYLFHVVSNTNLLHDILPIMPLLLNVHDNKLFFL